jgi:multidrug resistance protein
MTLSISLYVLGYAAGPLLWAPLSEAVGRRLPFIAAYFFFTVSQLPVAVATNPETILVFRFLAGACGSATLVIPAAMVVDFLAPVPRSKVIGLYMFCVFLGPVIGPVAGAWLVEDRLLGWQYTAWIVLFTSTIFGIFAFFAIPESYSEILLQKKAARLRLETQNWALHSKRDEKLVGLGALLDTYMKKPVEMIFREPIVSLHAIPRIKIHISARAKADIIEANLHEFVQRSSVRPSLSDLLRLSLLLSRNSWVATGNSFFAVSGHASGHPARFYRTRYIQQWLVDASFCRTGPETLP